MFCNGQIHIFKPTMDRTIKPFEQLGTMTNRPILERPATNEEKHIDFRKILFSNT